MNLFGKSANDLGAEFEKATCAKDANGSHKSDESWKNLSDRFHALFSSSDKVVVDICFHENAISDDREDYKWNQIIRQMDK